MSRCSPFPALGRLRLFTRRVKGVRIIFAPFPRHPSQSLSNDHDESLLSERGTTRAVRLLLACFLCCTPLLAREVVVTVGEVCMVKLAYATVEEPICGSTLVDLQQQFGYRPFCGNQSREIRTIRPPHYGIPQSGICEPSQVNAGPFPCWAKRAHPGMEIPHSPPSKWLLVAVICSSAHGFDPRLRGLFVASSRASYP